MQQLLIIPFGGNNKIENQNYNLTIENLFNISKINSYLSQEDRKILNSSQHIWEIKTGNNKFKDLNIDAVVIFVQNKDGGKKDQILSTFKIKYIKNNAPQIGKVIWKDEKYDKIIFLNKINNFNKIRWSTIAQELKYNNVKTPRSTICYFQILTII